MSHGGHARNRSSLISPPLANGSWMLVSQNTPLVGYLHYFKRSISLTSFPTVLSLFTDLTDFPVRYTHSHLWAFAPAILSGECLELFITFLPMFSWPPPGHCSGSPRCHLPREASPGPSPPRPNFLLHFHHFLVGNCPKHQSASPTVI